MNKKVAAIVAGAAVVVLGAVALFGGSKGNATEAKESVVTVIDGRGEVEVPVNPETVVTFDYGALDVLGNMGIEVAGLPKQGLPNYFSQYKDDKYINLGGLKEPDFESVSAADPDLIIISGRQEDMYDKFAEIAPTILLDIDGNKCMEDFARNTTALGTIFDKQNLVDEKLATIQAEIDEINKTVTENNLTAGTIMVNEGNISAYGAESRFGIIYNNLGFLNMDDNKETATHGSQISFEYLVEKNPEYLFVVDRGAATGQEGTAKSVLANELVKATDAYKNDKIIYLDSVSWYTIAGGFDSTQRMIDDIANAI